MQKIRYRIIIILIIGFSFYRCSKQLEPDIYFDSHQNILYKNNDTLVFFSKYCITPYNLIKKQDYYLISNKAFHCRNKKDNTNTHLKIEQKNDQLVLERQDSCFLKYFHDSSVIFNKVIEVTFNFNWNYVEIDYRENSSASSTYKTIKYKKRELSNIQIIKLWLISNPDFEMQNKCSDCSYFVIKFYNGKSLVLEKELINLPCWYIEMK